MKPASLFRSIILLPLLLSAAAMSFAQGIITSIAGNGVTQYIGDGWPATTLSLGFPYGICVGPEGNVYVADYIDHRIRMVDVHDTLFTIANTPGLPGHTGDNGPAIAATFDNPIGICIDISGNLYISEEYNNDIRKIDHTTGLITTICGTGAGGYYGDLGPATLAHMERPSGLCVDRDGNIYIADYGNARVRKIDVALGHIATVAGIGTNGSAGDAGLATAAQLSYPKAVCVDTSGNLYIADYGNNAIRKVDAATGIISTIAGGGSPAYSGDGGPAINAKLRQPNAVYMNRQGILYISDFGNDVVRAITPAGYIFTVAGNGMLGYTGDGGPATNATLHGPTGVYADDLGYLYIADGENSVIRKVTPQVLAINTQPEQGSFSVFPNPSRGTFNVVLPANTHDAFITITNTLGQVVYNATAATTNITINLNEPPGIYYLSVMGDGRYTGKIVITP
jgi:sugar lactone lactonase YvrE